MRYPVAIWRPTDKHGYPNSYTHLQNGVVIHSAEGSLAGALSVLDGPRQASWHFFITKTGEVYQHVDTDNIAWTNGGFDANRLFWGIECEGVEGEPLTEPQFDALVGVLRWLWDVHQVGAPVRQETMWEHNEMTQFGSAPTSCPSGRIPWERLISELKPIEEEDMKLKIIKTHSSPTQWVTDGMTRWPFTSQAILDEFAGLGLFEGGHVIITDALMAAIPRSHGPAKKSGSTGATAAEVADELAERLAE